MKLYTIGYEGAALTAFIACLRSHAVQTLVDVRATPLSRKAGFSKTALSLALAAAGVRYIHMPLLGCPKPIRDQYRIDGDWSQYRRTFTRYLTGQDAAVDQLAAEARASACALMCFEADAQRCHRSIVAAAVGATQGARIEHLRVLPVKEAAVADLAFA